MRNFEVREESAAWNNTWNDIAASCFELARRYQAEDATHHQGEVLHGKPDNPTDTQDHQASQSEPETQMTQLIDVAQEEAARPKTTTVDSDQGIQAAEAAPGPQNGEAESRENKDEKDEHGGQINEVSNNHEAKARPEPTTGSSNNAGKSSKTKQKTKSKTKKQAESKPAFVEWKLLENNDPATLVCSGDVDFPAPQCVPGIKQVDFSGIEFPFTEYGLPLSILYTVTDFTIIQNTSLERLKAFASPWRPS